MLAQSIKFTQKSKHVKKYTVDWFTNLNYLKSKKKKWEEKKLQIYLSSGFEKRQNEIWHEICAKAYTNTHRKFRTYHHPSGDTEKYRLLCYLNISMHRHWTHKKAVQSFRKMSQTDLLAKIMWTNAFANFYLYIKSEFI